MIFTPTPIFYETRNMKPETYHEKLKNIMDEYVHLVYGFTRQFPKEELFGLSSQLNRASI